MPHVMRWGDNGQLAESGVELMLVEARAEQLWLSHSTLAGAPRHEEQGAKVYL